MNTPIHQWTHDGSEVLITRFCEADGSSSYGYTYPMTVGASVEAPDWDPKPECGNGLHGWPWGMNVGDGKDPEWDKVWMVIGAKPADVVDLGGKVKIRRGTIRAIGKWFEVGNFVLNGQMAWVHARTHGKPECSENISGSASATGWSGSASATGERGSASATGGRGSASATGDCSSAVCTGLDGRAMGGKYSVIALAWWNPKAQRAEMRTALIGRGDGKDKKLKAGVWYVLNKAGKFVEADHA